MTVHALPTYKKIVILINSSGGVHFDSMAAVAGKVTACEHMEIIRTQQS